MITCFNYDLIKVKKKLVPLHLLIVKILDFVGCLSNLLFVDICINFINSINLKQTKTFYA